jgi:hypothetical protein
MTMNDSNEHEAPNRRWDSSHGSPAARRNRLALPLTLAGLSLLAATGAGFGLRHVADQVVWERFDAVKPGVLYRSGQLRPDQLRAAIERYGIRTVVNFQVRDRSLIEEEALVRSLGGHFVNLPMPGDGFGDEAQFREVLALADDPGKRPILIHCAAGTCRTGAAVAMYRFERDGWTIDDVSAEMTRQAYDTGWLSGYVFNMLKTRPQYSFRDESAEAGADAPSTTNPASTDERVTTQDKTELRR